MLNRTVVPPIHDAISFDFKLQPIQTEICNNQMPLYWLNAGAQPVVQIDWILDAGLWYEPQTAVAQAVASLLKNGTQTKSALQINETIEYYGASLKVSANNDYTIITLHTLTKHLEVLLPLIKEIITEATFPDEELELFQQNAKQRLSVNLRQCEFVANRYIDSFLFGKDHPYGRFTEAQNLDALTTHVLRAFHKKYYHAANCKMFMAGKFEDIHINLARTYFGNAFWGISNIENNNITYEKEVALEKRYRITNDENGVQGAIRIARPFPTREHPDFTPMIVLNTLFGGYFGSRLMSNIREEKGYTYGIYSQIYNYKHDAALLIATEAGKDVCEATIEEVYKEMDLIKTQRIDEEELRLVKNYLLGNLLGDLDGPFSIMQRWKNIILNNLPEDQFYKNVALYKQVDTESLHQLAQKYFNKEDYYELVVV